MADKMVRTQVYLPRDIYEQLKQRARAEGITMATQIREALGECVTEMNTWEKGQVLTDDDPIWGLIGSGKSDVADGSVNHDKYIYVRDWDPIEEDKQ